MIRTVVLVLAGLGVVMVLSSSMAYSFASSSSVWAQAIRQTVMVAGGLGAMWVMLKTSPDRLRRLSHVIMGVAIFLLVLVLTPAGTGREEVGSQSWLVLGPLSLQPSEFARVAIAIWGAAILANKDHTRPSRLDNGFAPFVAVATVCVGLIGLQGDYGMAVSFAIVVGFILIFAGISWRVIAAACVAAAFGMLLIFLSGGYRSNRFHVYFDALFGNFDDTRGIAFQSHQGFLSLADGSFFGVGLGQSRAKWFYLPEARNDFIFAVIGEELGLWGGALVIALFGLLAFFGLRTARRARNQFQALLAAALTAGVVSQAFINIAYVLGLLPVTGIQLPMLSAGGTSAVITLGAMGILASVARHEPDAVSAMQNYGRPAFDCLFGIGEPKAPRQVRGRAAAPEHPGQQGRATGRGQRFGTPVTARPAPAPVPGGSRRPAPARYDVGRDRGWRSDRRVS
ncbi:cell division protein [Corynebacterium liangguodongii]|uniref:Probable peptidoglycan glycosyltransferase FtsW n=2 Tax=Corynebacterium liangguodongii TaxID=2079535 RepID=A0A2S0WH58_9CORY|nr:cell division protein [Corynebacterium liangguodongii]PWB99957.1 cell division protein FtsW [Corynebacterium liangguodongii]